MFDPAKLHHPAEGKRTTHIPLDSMSLVIAMDPQLQEKEEELSVIGNVNDEEEHPEGDGHTAIMVDRFMKTP